MGHDENEPGKVQAFLERRANESPREERRALASGQAWRDLVECFDYARHKGMHVDKVTIKGGYGPTDELLIVIMARTEDGPVVAFHGADDPERMWVSLFKRFVNDELKWRPDEYRNE